MLYYVPLEGYRERYTLQWAAPETGWVERGLRRGRVAYHRIDPETGGGPPRTIKSGSVVDAVGRSTFCFRQIEALLALAEQDKLCDQDVIFFDDFWTPGLEALPYAFKLLKVRPRMYAFLHAQSVDEFDFTAAMLPWIRDIEIGYGRLLDGIMVCCPTLKQMVLQGGIADDSKVHVTGHPFSSEEVMTRMPKSYRYMMGDTSVATEYVLHHPPRKNQIVWSSRWDAEKNPDFFLRVAARVIEADGPYGNEPVFVVCTSAPKLRTNNPALIGMLKTMMARYPGRIVLREGLTKEEYYAILCESKIQFNCASQDFVAITLLEASVAGCWPIYPYFRSFPETFLWENGIQHMYAPLNTLDAATKIIQTLNRDDLWTPQAIKNRAWIHSRFDTSWMRMLSVMGLAEATRGAVSAGDWLLGTRDPFDKKEWGTWALTAGNSSES